MGESAAASDEQLAAALAATGYEFTDPVADPFFRRITTRPSEPPDRFPDYWGASATERDQAAIDAGNA